MFIDIFCRDTLLFAEQQAERHSGQMLPQFSIATPHLPEKRLGPEPRAGAGSGGRTGTAAGPPPAFGRGAERSGPAAHLGVGAQLPLVLVEQGGRGGAGGADQDLQAGVAGGAPAGGPAGEGAGEALPELPHRQHRAVGRAAAAPLLQRRAKPAAAQTQEGEQAGGDEEEAQPHALVLRLRVLVSRPAPRHGRAAAGPRRRASATAIG